MNTLIFMAGLGGGCVVAVLLFVVVLGMATRGQVKDMKDRQARDARTVELLAERNTIGRRIEQHLSQMVPTMQPPQRSFKQELCDYLDGQQITSENIGDIRRRLFVPWDSEWNSIVRDETAARENKAA